MTSVQRTLDKLREDDLRHKLYSQSTQFQESEDGERGSLWQIPGPRTSKIWALGRVLVETMPRQVRVQNQQDISKLKLDREFDGLCQAEQDFVSGVLRCDGLMQASLRIFRRVREGLIQDTGALDKAYLMDVISQGIHQIKVFTARFCYSKEVQPQRVELTEVRKNNRMLKAEFNKCRADYLKEVTFLRNEARVRADPESELGAASDIMHFYDPTFSLDHNELKFVSAVVSEKLKMIFERNPLLQHECDLTKLEQLMERVRAGEVRDLKASLKRSKEEQEKWKKECLELRESTGQTEAAVPTPKHWSEKQREGILMQLEVQVEELRASLWQEQSARNKDLKALDTCREDCCALQNAYDQEIAERMSLQQRMNDMQEAMDMKYVAEEKASAMEEVLSRKSEETHQLKETLERQIKMLRALALFHRKHVAPDMALAVGDFSFATDHDEKNARRDSVFSRRRHSTGDPRFEDMRVEMDTLVALNKSAPSAKKTKKHRDSQGSAPSDKKMSGQALVARGLNQGSSPPKPSRYTELDQSARLSGAVSSNTLSTVQQCDDEEGGADVIDISALAGSDGDGRRFLDLIEQAEVCAVETQARNSELQERFDQMKAERDGLRRHLRRYLESEAQDNAEAELEKFNCLREVAETLGSAAVADAARVEGTDDGSALSMGGLAAVPQTPLSAAAKLLPHSPADARSEATGEVTSPILLSNASSPVPGRTSVSSPASGLPVNVEAGTSADRGAAQIGMLSTASQAVSAHNSAGGGPTQNLVSGGEVNALELQNAVSLRDPEGLRALLSEAQVVLAESHVQLRDALQQLTTLRNGDATGNAEGNEKEISSCLELVEQLTQKIRQGQFQQSQVEACLEVNRYKEASQASLLDDEVGANSMSTKAFEVSRQMQMKMGKLVRKLSATLEETVNQNLQLVASFSNVQKEASIAAEALQNMSSSRELGGNSEKLRVSLHKICTASIFDRLHYGDPRKKEQMLERRRKLREQSMQALFPQLKFDPGYTENKEKEALLESAKSDNHQKKSMSRSSSTSSAGSVAFGHAKTEGAKPAETASISFGPAKTDGVRAKARPVSSTPNKVSPVQHGSGRARSASMDASVNNRSQEVAPQKLASPRTLAPVTPSTARGRSQGDSSGFAEKAGKSCKARPRNFSANSSSPKATSRPIAGAGQVETTRAVVETGAVELSGGVAVAEAIKAAAGLPQEGGTAEIVDNGDDMRAARTSKTGVSAMSEMARQSGQDAMRRQEKVSRSRAESAGLERCFGAQEKVSSGPAHLAGRERCSSARSANPQQSRGSVALSVLHPAELIPEAPPSTRHRRYSLPNVASCQDNEVEHLPPIAGVSGNAVSPRRPASAAGNLDVMAPKKPPQSLTEFSCGQSYHEKPLVDSPNMVRINSDTEGRKGGPKRRNLGALSAMSGDTDLGLNGMRCDAVKS